VVDQLCYTERPAIDNLGAYRASNIIETLDNYYKMNTLKVHVKTM